MLSNISDLSYILYSLEGVLEPWIQFLLHRNFLGLSTRMNVPSSGNNTCYVMSKLYVRRYYWIDSGTYRHNFLDVTQFNSRYD